MALDDCAHFTALNLRYGANGNTRTSAWNNELTHQLRHRSACPFVPDTGGTSLLLHRLTSVGAASGHNHLRGAPGRHGGPLR